MLFLLLPIFLVLMEPQLRQTESSLALQNPNPLTERAYQDREILYELQSPESHAFRITHDYTVRKVGEKYYFNVVRAGSHVTNPESIDLDSGEFRWRSGLGVVDELVDKGVPRPALPTSADPLSPLEA